MSIFKQLFSRQLGRNYTDREPRGRGNRAARRAIATQGGREHLRDCGEDIYTDRPAILERGVELIICSRELRYKAVTAGGVL